MGRRDRHEAVAPGFLDGLLPGAHQRVVRARERDLVHDDQLAAGARDVHALPERQRAEEAGLRVGGEVLDQLAQGVLALEQDRQLRDPGPQLLRRLLGRAHGGEEAQGPPAGRLHQFGELVEHVAPVPVARGAGEVLGDVQDALSGVVERRADVDALPDRQVVAGGALGGEAERGPDAVEVAAQLERGRGEHHGPLREQLLPEQAGDGERRDPQRGTTVSICGSAAGLVPLVPDDVVLGPLRDPLRDAVDGLHRGHGLLAHGVLVLHGPVAGRPQGRDHGAGRVPQRHQGVREVLRDLLQAARQRQLHDPLEALGGGLQLVGDLLVHELRGPPHRTVDLAGGELSGGDAGHAGDQFVGLVDDQHLVLREHRGALDGVDGEQRVVGDDDVRELGALAGRLGEALGPVGALARAEALPGGDRDLGPGPVGDARRQVVPVAGLRLVRPVPQAHQVLAQLAGGRGRLEGVEEAFLLVLRHAFVEPVQAEVVRPPLEHGELRAPAQLRMQRVDRPGKVALDELALQRQGGRGHHHPLPLGQRRHEVAERLAGAGAGLDEEVGVVVDGLGHGLGHGDLAGPLRAADGGDGGMEEVGEGWLRHSPPTLRGGTDSPVTRAGWERSRGRPRGGARTGRGSRPGADGCG